MPSCTLAMFLNTGQQLLLSDTLDFAGNPLVEVHHAIFGCVWKLFKLANWIDFHCICELTQHCHIEVLSDNFNFFSIFQCSSVILTLCLTRRYCASLETLLKCVPPCQTFPCIPSPAAYVACLDQTKNKDFQLANKLAAPLSCFAPLVREDMRGGKWKMGMHCMCFLWKRE